jgi:hypothetical protein
LYNKRTGSLRLRRRGDGYGMGLIKREWMWSVAQPFVHGFVQASWRENGLLSQEQEQFLANP